MIQSHQMRKGFKGNFEIQVWASFSFHLHQIWNAFSQGRLSQFFLVVLCLFHLVSFHCYDFKRSACVISKSLNQHSCMRSLLPLLQFLLTAFPIPLSISYFFLFLGVSEIFWLGLDLTCPRLLSEKLVLASKLFWKKKIDVEACFKVFVVCIWSTF